MGFPAWRLSTLVYLRKDHFVGVIWTTRLSDEVCRGLPALEKKVDPSGNYGVLSSVSNLLATDIRK